MWFVVAFLIFAILIVSAGAYLIIWDLRKTNARLKTFSLDVQKNVVLQDEKIAELTEERDILRAQKASVDQMIELGFLKVAETNVIDKEKINARLAKAEAEDSNVVYLGRHA
jgi:TolA-binding protein